MSGFRPLFRLVAASLLGLSSALAAPAAAQTQVENVATFSFRTASGAQTISSNRTTLDVGSRIKRPTKLSFRRPREDFVFRNRTAAACQAGDPARYTPSDMTVSELQASTPLESLAIEDNWVAVLDSEGSNRDPNVRETAWIYLSSDFSTIITILTETGPNSGVFAGAVPGLPAARNPEAENSPCNNHAEKSRVFRVRFLEDDYSYGSDSSLLIDPQGYAFDSQTGAIIDGAIVSVVDAATGQPAAVYSDDGVTAYPSTVTTGQNVTDAIGDVEELAPGRFRFPLMAPGTYRLVVTPPKGYRAPSTASASQLSSLTAPDGLKYKILDASYGRAFTLSSPEPLYVDIPLDPDREGSILLEKTASTRTASPGDTIQYRLHLTNRDTTRALPATTIADSLPVGLRFRLGTTRGATEPQVSSDGRTVTYSIGSLAAGQSVDIRYLVEVAPGAPVGEAVNRAQATTVGGSSNEASASVRIKPLLFSDAMTIIGRVTEGDCADPSRDRKGVPGVRLMLDDGTLVTTDRDGLYHFEGVKAGTHVVQIDQYSIAATHEAVSCDRDTRAAGSAISRFVEAGGGSLNRVDFQLRRTARGAAVTNDMPVAAADADVAGGTTSWLKDQAPGVDWLFPAVDHNPRAPALRVVIKHRPGQRVALRINGAPVDPMAFDGSDQDDARGVAISTWTGIPLTERENLLQATVLDANGAVAATLERTVHYATAPVHAEYLPDASRLVADGLAKPLVAIRLTDRDGKPVRAGTLIGFSVDQPYAAAFDAEIEAQRQLAGRERSAATARVIGDDGIAYIALQPTTQGGAVHLTTLMDEKGVSTHVQFRPWLTAAAQGWTVVGFGKGTIGYNRLRARSTSLPKGEKGGIVTDGELKFYAKGRIKGSWLMTIAYDSDRAYDPDRGLLGTIDPDRYYTVYGDGSRQTYDAATSRKLYLRLERREFRALFGDFETGLTETHLTRYSRTLNGVKAEYQGRRLTFTGFAAKNDQLYGRDEIQGSGLSGPYRLSGQGIVPNSDKVRLETRDRVRPEKIVATRQLTRHIDYDIDTDAGTLRFRDPVLSRDLDFNPVFIIAEYETAQGRSKALVAGGRVATRMADGRMEVGASLLRDESVRAGTVAGLDMKARIAKGTEIRAEAATGGRDGLGKGRAYEAEIIHQSPTADITAYVREQDSNFGLGQQNAVEAGTRKIGADGRIHLSERLSISGAAWHQVNLDDAGKRTAAQARLELRTLSGIVFAGAEIASDTGITGQNRDSRLLTLGGSQRPFDQKLEIFGQTQVAIGGADQSVDFPIRHRLGVAYEIRQGFRLIAEHEIADGTVKAHQTRVGVDVAPWTGAKLLGTLAQEAVGENGARTFAQYGLNQSIPFDPHWTVDATVDATTTVSGTVPSGSVVNPLHPAATGSLEQGDINGDHQAFTLGATYRGALWTWNGRVEYRHGSTSDRWGVTSNALRTLGRGKTVAGGIRAYSVKERSGAVASYASADLAIAFRPLDSRWAVLERLEVRHDRADAGVRATNVLGIGSTGNGQVSTRIINNLAISYRSGQEGDGHGWEASVYHGAKYVEGRFDDDRYTGFIDVVGFELRRDLGQRFDIGVNASRQHSWTSKATNFSAGPSVGFSPGKNIWMSAGYNVTGFRDRDFEDARYTRQGAYVTLRMKFDQLSLGKAARSLTGANGR